MSSLWWVELGFDLLMGSVMSLCVFGGGCELSITLGSLSADEWDCVPLLLVVQPEAFQHWSLQAVGQGWVLVQKQGPLEELTSVNIPWGLCCLCPSPTVSYNEPLPPQETW